MISSRIGVSGIASIVFIFSAVYLLYSSPEVQRSAGIVQRPIVEVTNVRREDYQVVINTRGTIKPHTQSTIMPEVSAKVIEVSDKFREGAFFEKDDVLLRLDPIDYQTAVLVAKASLARRNTILAEEKARSAQAKENWLAIGNGDNPSPLVLRIPQLREAEAEVESSRAQLAQAKKNLERCTLRAPYDGRILKKMVDLGQFVSPGIAVVEIYATDYVEVELPLSIDQLRFISERSNPEISKLDRDYKVLLSTGQEKHAPTWTGRIVRTLGAVDVRSRQLSVVAQVDNPFRKHQASKVQLKIGMFVEAKILGDMINNALVVPREAIRDGETVLIVDDKSRLQRRLLEILWQDESSVVIASGIEPHEQLVLTPLRWAVDNTEVIAQLKPEQVQPSMDVRKINGPHVE